MLPEKTLQDRFRIQRTSHRFDVIIGNWTTYFYIGKCKSRFCLVNIYIAVHLHTYVDMVKYFVLKLIFYKNNAKPPIVTRNLHDPAPIFQANTHQNTGQNRANFV